MLLYPLYHPAAALYTPSMLRALEDDFARLPALLGHAAGDAGRPQPARLGRGRGARRAIEVVDRPTPKRAAVGAVQLGLF